MKRGDTIASVAQPIARGIDAVIGTNVAGCSGCKQMQENLNSGMSLVDSIYERWFKAKQQGEKMKYQITVVVDAEKCSDAVSKAESIGEVLNAVVKPIPQARPLPPTGVVARP
jgi:hypothetical protein